LTSEDKAKKYFTSKLTDRERAVFEAGIALGAIYHQLVGLPVKRDQKLLRLLGEALSQAFNLQPHRVKVKVSIEADKIKSGKDFYAGYEALKGEHLNVAVETVYGKAKVKARLKYIPEIDYPLMYVEEISG
jgi:hypothetical protein